MRSETPCTMERPGSLQLVDRLAAEMAECWRRGQPVCAEELLERYPDLVRHPDEAVRLIYEEICLRREHGQPVVLAELAQRFPRCANELAVLLECDQVLRSSLAPPFFPETRESLGDFYLVAELGRGAAGRVFLATQPALADRPVVLKVTSRRAREHLLLARLQHTHIIPLHAVYDFPARNVRALCMPFLGGATLDRLLDSFHDRPPAQRTGQLLINALDAAQKTMPVRVAGRGVYRDALAGASYVEAISRIGLCLADGLHYAHERGLLHLDLKPSNVLIAADGQPFLLDFHLANEPLAVGQMAPQTSGGTTGFVAPEQVHASAAVSQGKSVPVDVDGRADLYSLGRLLYVALAGEDEAAQFPLPSLHRCNPAVSLGLSDIIHKCLSLKPEDRYPGSLAFAGDLRRQLEDLPLKGVRNRSPGERWRKWRRRRPNAALWAGLLLALLAAGAVLVGAILERHRDARRALAEGRDQRQRGAYEDAVRTLTHGLDRASSLPAAGRLVEAFDHELAQARGERAAEGTGCSELVALGQSLLRAGELQQAAAKLEKAVTLRPQDFWANFFLGTCNHRRARYADAVQAFSIAVALAPECAECYYNRALAYAGSGDRSKALRDYDRALELAPHLGAAALNRGVLHYEAGQHAAALRDLKQALRDGAEPATAHYNLALVHVARREAAEGIQSLEQALRHEPKHREALALQQRLRQKP